MATTVCLCELTGLTSKGIFWPPGGHFGIKTSKQTYFFYSDASAGAGIDEKTTGAALTRTFMAHLWPIHGHKWPNKKMAIYGQIYGHIWPIYWYIGSVDCGRRPIELCLENWSQEGPAAGNQNVSGDDYEVAHHGFKNHTALGSPPDQRWQITSHWHGHIWQICAPYVGHT